MSRAARVAEAAIDRFASSATVRFRCRVECDSVALIDSNYRLTSPRARACFRGCAGFDDYPPSIAGTLAYWLGGCLAARKKGDALDDAARGAACAPPYSRFQVGTALLAGLFVLLALISLVVLAASSSG